MSAGVCIRLAGAGDVGTILALQREYPQVVSWSETAWEGALGGDGVPLRRVWVAERENSLAGFVVLGFAAGSAEFEMVLVDEAARGRGIGRALCKAAMQWASAHGAACIELEVRESNAAARALYASLGFVEQGARRNYYHQPTEDAVLMGVAL